MTFIAPARAIEKQAAVDPHGMAALRQAIADGWADVAGGTYSEAEDALLPLESILWQFARGGDVYRAHLDERSVETFARRRFGLYVQLPQIAKRFGIRYAMHMAFDAGRFPMRPETKRLWEGPDGSSLESLLRPPIAADRPSQGWRLAWRLAATMRDDHVAAVPMVRWPSPVAPWFDDLRRVATYSPVLGRWTTLNDFFHLTDRPYETFRPDPDAYATPYLAQAVARRDAEPISLARPPSTAPGPARRHADDPGVRPGHRLGGRRSGDPHREGYRRICRPPEVIEEHDRAAPSRRCGPAISTGPSRRGRRPWPG